MIARQRDPIIVVPYLGYGTPTKLTLSGRVLEDEDVEPPAETDPLWRNVVSFLKRIESDEVSGARVRATFGNSSVATMTDDEGYFRVEFETAAVSPGWHRIQLELEGSDAAEGAVLVPPADAQFGVISDIDDTIVHTDVMQKLRMLVTLACSNARTRKPFEGVAAFYRALQGGRNPFFYVSNSPWNLYVPLIEFLQRQELPPGPLLLRDFGLRMKPDHKAGAIADILNTYPELKFILIGDSGEQDPEVYSAIVRRFPERIRVIYIRSIDPSVTRLAGIAKLAQTVAPTGCQLVLAPDSAFAAAHAAAEGLMSADHLADVHADKAADRLGQASVPP